MNIDPNLLIKLEQTLDNSKFNTTQELIEYMISQYIYFYVHNDSLEDLIETYKDTIDAITNYEQ